MIREMLLREVFGGILSENTLRELKKSDYYFDFQLDLNDSEYISLFRGNMSETFDVASSYISPHDLIHELKISIETCIMYRPSLYTLYSKPIGMSHKREKHHDTLMLRLDTSHYSFHIKDRKIVACLVEYSSLREAILSPNIFYIYYPHKFEFTAMRLLSKEAIISLSVSIDENTQGISILVDDRFSVPPMDPNYEILKSIVKEFYEYPTEIAYKKLEDVIDKLLNRGGRLKLDSGDK